MARKDSENQKKSMSICSTATLVRRMIWISYSFTGESSACPLRRNTRILQHRMTAMLEDDDIEEGARSIPLTKVRTGEKV